MMDWSGSTRLEVTEIIFQVLLNTYLNYGPNYARGM